MALPNTNTSNLAIKRLRLWYGLLLVVLCVIVVRLFYVQIINYGHYRAAALNDQLKQYEIPATRGLIKAYDGNAVIPMVLNQKLYTLYADPGYIKQPEQLARRVAAVIGGDAGRYEALMRAKDTRYVVLAKRLPAEQQKKILALKSPGLGTQAVYYRIYPQNSLASQLLGFVDNEGRGQYGVEQALNKLLSGTPGELRAITDVNGVPLAASKDNVQKAPLNGKDVVLTIDLAMQQQLETILQNGVKRSRGTSGSALIMDPYTGAVKAMANYPTYDAAKFTDVEDARLFQNNAVSHPIEVGSVMKPLTTAAAINQGVIKANTTYYDPAFFIVDKFRITNIEEDGGAGQRSIAQLLNLSLNTGATWELMQMGGGSINEKARQTWYEYLTGRYLFGKQTGIEQGYEASGYVPGPSDNGAGINLTYANTAFGQAMTATPIQMGAALSAAINGGTYYQPRLLDATLNADGNPTKIKPKVVRRGVVSRQTSDDIIPLMQYVVQNHSFSPQFDQKLYTVGGKTGTAQIAKPGGGYEDNLFNGTYIGFVGAEKPKYVIIVFVNKPLIGGYAGSAAAQPIFGELAHMLINDSYVAPKSHE